MKKQNIQISIIRRILLIPLVAIVVSIIGIAYISSLTVKSSLLDKMKTNGVNMAEEVIERIEDNKEALDIIDTLLDNKILNVANIVVNNELNLTNEKLEEIARELGVSQLTWYDNLGEAIYSNRYTRLGWEVPKGHRIDKYLKSGKVFYIEEDLEGNSRSKIYRKSGYLKTPGGDFVRVIVDSNNLERFGYQALFEKLALKDEIAYAYYTDQNLNITSHNDKEQIGKKESLNEKFRDSIINGEIYSQEYFYTQDNIEVYHVAVPVITDGKVVGALNLGYSMKKVQEAVAMTTFNIYMLGAILLILLVLIFRRVQKKQVVGPIIDLDRDIQLISFEDDIEYRLPIQEGDPFNQLRETTNVLLSQTQIYFESMSENQEELFAANQELEAILNQLRANEQLLLGQYNEISKQNEHIEFVAYHDDLTGLPNRRQFTRNLGERLKSDNEGAILLLDIDNFKNINDALGHRYGDKVLKYVSDLLKEVSCKDSTLYRFGGDEFLIDIRNQSDCFEDCVCLNSVLDSFKTSHLVEDIENYISVSIGIVRYPLDGESVEELLKKVDIAMYSAKKSGKDKYVLFGDHMTSSFLNKIKIEKALRKAIEREEFTLLYQPIIEMQTGEIKYFEALIRLSHIKIYPDEFIPIAEETRLILPIGRWVIKEVIGQLRKWKDQGYKPKAIAINLSPKQMEDTRLVEFLKRQIKENNIDPALIEIEITEGILLENKEKNIKILEKIQELGITISLDDFGTGYSSLNSLTYIPVNKVKLDKSLKDKFIYHESSQVIDGIISLIHALKLEVVIEGVEDLEEVIRLKATGSDYLQGYFFSRPIPASEVKKIINTNYLNNMKK